MEKSAVFERTYRAYLKEIAAIDYLASADVLGGEKDGGRLVIPFYNHTYSISPEGIERVDGGPATDAVRVVLAQYVLSCPEEVVEDANQWCTYREFRDGAPLVSYFTSNTNKTIETHFSGRLELLKDRCGELGAVIGVNESYDLSVTFACLPRIPVMLNYNDADDMFPAGCSVLYRRSAQHYIDMECLAITGTLLAGKLIGAAS